jgi:hypothetical protein
MRKALLTLVLLFVFLITYSQSLTPRQPYPGVFEAVQLTDIFPDNKILPRSIAEARIHTHMRVFDTNGGLMKKYNGINLLDNYPVDQL